MSQAAVAADGWPFADALHAEWTKLRTLASTGWLLLGVVALTVAVSAAAERRKSVGSWAGKTRPAKSVSALSTRSSSPSASRTAVPGTAS